MSFRERARPNVSFFCGTPQVLYSGDPEEIRNKIQALGYDLDARNYQFLNRKNLGSLRDESSFEMVPSTFGKKYILFLTRMGEKNYSLFISKKTGEQINGKLTFATSLFKNTLIEGELVKTSQGKWVFLVGDLLVEENNSLMDKSWSERKSCLKELLEKKYRHDESSSHCLLRMKHYLPLSAMRDYTEKVIPALSYRVSGLIFRHKTTYGGDFLYVFPESRTDTVHVDTLGDQPAPLWGTKVEQKTPNHSKAIVTEVSAEIHAPSVVTTPPKGVVAYLRSPKGEPGEMKATVEETKVTMEDDFLSGLEGDCILDTVFSAPKPSNTCVFLVEKKPGPDVYQLFCRGLEKHSFACVPSTQESQALKKVFEGGVAQRPMRCVFNPRFNKWVPKEVIVEGEIDTSQTVQEIQAKILRTWVDDEDDI